MANKDAGNLGVGGMEGWGGVGLDGLLPSRGGNAEGSDPILMNITKKWG